jgi:hypothetical protein
VFVVQQLQDLALDGQAVGEHAAGAVGVEDLDGDEVLAALVEAAVGDARSAGAEDLLDIVPIGDDVGVGQERGPPVRRTVPLAGGTRAAFGVVGGPEGLQAAAAIASAHDPPRGRGRGNTRLRIQTPQPSELFIGNFGGLDPARRSRGNCGRSVPRAHRPTEEPP